MRVPGRGPADNPPPSQVLSNFENYYGANVVRDCGYSQPLPADPASSLWLFCDTDVYGFNAHGAVAAVGHHQRIHGGRGTRDGR